MHPTVCDTDGGVDLHAEYSCSSDPVALFRAPAQLPHTLPQCPPAGAKGLSRRSKFVCSGSASPHLLGQNRVRWQLRLQRTTGFASIGGAGDAASRAASSIGNTRCPLQGPGNVLRLQAEELRQAASERARRMSQHHTKSQRRKAHRHTKEQRQQVVGEGVNHLKHMLAGALSACVSKTIVAPLERIKMDCILRRRGVSTALVTLDILRDEGIVGFWRGNLLNVLRTAPYKVCVRVLSPAYSVFSNSLDTYNL